MFIYTHTSRYGKHIDLCVCIYIIYIYIYMYIYICIHVYVYLISTCIYSYNCTYIYMHASMATVLGAWTLQRWCCRDPRECSDKVGRGGARPNTIAVACCGAELFWSTSFFRSISQSSEGLITTYPPTVVLHSKRKCSKPLFGVRGSPGPDPP